MKKNSIKLIIFDGYGVILSRGYPDTCRALAEKFKLPEKELLAIIYRKYFELAAERKISQKAAWQLSVKYFNLPMSWQALRDLHLRLLKVNQPALNLAIKLNQRYKTLLLSKNTRTQFFETKKKFPKVWRSFDVTINVWELGLPKASKQTIFVICKKFKVLPKEILYIDDQKSNLIQPKKLGVKTIFYKNFFQFKKELNKYLS